MALAYLVFGKVRGREGIPLRQELGAAGAFSQRRE
jgi:hypothetical protein